MRSFLQLLCVAIVFGAMLGGTGCVDNSDGLTAEQKGTKDKFQGIMERSGGKWEQLSAEDRDYVVNKLSNGNEEAARRMFEMRAQRATAAAGPGGGSPAPR